MAGPSWKKQAEELLDVMHVVRASRAERRLEKGGEGVSWSLLQHEGCVPCITVTGFSFTPEHQTCGPTSLTMSPLRAHFLSFPWASPPPITEPGTEDVQSECDSTSRASKHHGEPASCLLSPKVYTFLLLLLPKKLASFPAATETLWKVGRDG